MLEGELFLVVDQVNAVALLELLLAEVNWLVGGELLLGDRVDVVHDAVDEDFAAVIDHTSHEVDQVGHGLVTGAAEDARVEVAVGALNLNDRMLLDSAGSDFEFLA